MQEQAKQEDLIYGMWPVIEALDQGKEIHKILIQRGIDGKTFAQLKDRLKGSHIPIQLVPVQKLNKLSNTNHQGVIAMVSPVKYHLIKNLLPALLEKNTSPKLVVLDHITDVRNFGAIARTAECMGYDAILIAAKGSALITPDAIKTSAGALYKIPVCKEQNLRDALEYLSDMDVSIYACTEKADEYITDQSFEGPIAVVLGSEESGITKDLLNRSHYVCKIPMQGDTTSLNVAVAAGMVMYETNRKK